MTTIKDMLLAALRDIGAVGVAWKRDYGWCVATLEDLDAGVNPLARPFDGRPVFRDDEGRLVPLPDWLECHGDAMCQGRGPHGEEVQVWCYGSDHFGLWIGRYATSDEEDDIELVSGDFPTAPAAWRAAEQWIKEQGR